MQTVIIKRSIVLAGNKTSVSLEDAFWNGLKDIARSQEVTLSEMVGDIDTQRLNGNLSSAIRLFVLAHFLGQTIDVSIVPDARSHTDAGGLVRTKTTAEFHERTG